jgi:hypothetical protein
VGYDLHSNPLIAVPKLKQLIDEYPEQTALYNYLYVAYAKSGQLDKAEKTLELTIRKFPSYLFGVVNYVLFKQDSSWILRHGPKLGKNLSLTDWPLRDDGTYHSSELLSFERAAIIYLVHLDKLPAAKDRINRLLRYGATEEELKICIDHFHVRSMERGLKRQKQQQQLARTAEHAITATVTSADAEYTLTHPELEQLFEVELEEMTEANLNTLLALPRESLVADLRKILRAGLAHYLLSYELEDWEDLDMGLYMHWHTPVTHALYLLGALEATEALPEVLDFLRIDGEASTYFFGDFKQTNFQPTLFSLTKDRPTVLVDYLLEPKNYLFDRVAALDVLLQIGLHYPSRRATAVEGFRQVWQRMLDQPDDRFFTDTSMAGFVLGKATELRATELLPLAQKLEDRNLINATIAGAVENVAHEFLRPIDRGHIDPQPATPFEYYSEAYQGRMAKFDFPISIEEYTTPLDMILVERLSKIIAERDRKDSEPGGYSLPRAQKPQVKVGRNAPCPCGSGRKYKKCCLGR